MSESDNPNLSPETAYELLAGRLPAAEAARVRQLCERDPAAAAVLAEAEAITAAMRPSTDAPSPALTDRILAAHRQQSRRRRRWAPLAAALAVAAAVVLGLWFALTRNAPSQTPPAMPAPPERVAEDEPDPADFLAEIGRSDPVVGAAEVLEVVKTELVRGGEAVTRFVQTVIAEVDFTTLIFESEPDPQTRTAPQGEGT